MKITTKIENISHEWIEIGNISKNRYIENFSLNNLQYRFSDLIPTENDGKTLLGRHSTNLNDRFLEICKDDKFYIKAPFSIFLTE